MAGDLVGLISAVKKMQNDMAAGIEDGMRKAGAIVAGTAKGKLGSYQPASGGYPAWKPLKPETIRRKFLSRKKSFHINDNGHARINLTRKGKEYLEKYGRDSKVFGGERQFQSSGGNDDSPLVDTGHLRASITTDDTDVKDYAIYIGIKGAPAVYARAHEFGSMKQNIPPRPYLRPSVYESLDEIQEAIGRSIAESMTGFR